jgi:hypothetical protein
MTDIACDPHHRLNLQSKLIPKSPKNTIKYITIKKKGLKKLKVTIFDTLCITKSLDTLCAIKKNGTIHMIVLRLNRAEIQRRLFLSLRQ